jgi:hypothetical protein
MVTMEQAIFGLLRNFKRYSSTINGAPPNPKE